MAGVATQENAIPGLGAQWGASGPSLTRRSLPGYGLTASASLALHHFATRATSPSAPPPIPTNAVRAATAVRAAVWRRYRWGDPRLGRHQINSGAARPRSARRPGSTAGHTRQLHHHDPRRFFVTSGRTRHSTTGTATQSDAPVGGGRRAVRGLSGASASRSHGFRRGDRGGGRGGASVWGDGLLRWRSAPGVAGEGALLRLCWAVLPCPFTPLPACLFWHQCPARLPRPARRTHRARAPALRVCG